MCEDIGRLTCEESNGKVSTSFDGCCNSLEGMSCSSIRAFLNPCDAFRGGGLGGKGESLFLFFSLVLLSHFTVELDEDDVRDSRNDGRPCGSNARGS